ncbi:MAG: 2-hydroxyacyl-CoA dehydratase [Candidatus Brocadiia bacterium]
MRIGITSTIPSEIVLSAGHTLVDLNNVFIASADRKEFVLTAERHGFPASCCGWIRGIFGALNHGIDIDALVAVSGGDCSNTNALAEVLRLDGIRVIPFSYPYAANERVLLQELAALALAFDTDIERAERIRSEISPIREQLLALDAALADGRIRPAEYSRLALASSDYMSNVNEYAAEVSAEVKSIELLKPQRWGLPIALTGVPPIIPDLHNTLEMCGLQVVFDEIPRQFTMPFRAHSLVEQYSKYTYPYGMAYRTGDIAEQCRIRGVKGIIHYTQSFCFRAIEDIVLRRMVDLPILTIEGDAPEFADERLRIRLESFAEMLAA